MRHIFLPLICLAILAACSNEPDAPNNRPGNGHAGQGGQGGETDNGSESPEDKPDYTSVLGDDQVRFQSDTLQLRFDDGGILYINEGEAYRLIDLAEGTQVSFDPTGPNLRINGRDATVSSCEIIGERNGVRWYAIYPGPQFFVAD